MIHSRWLRLFMLGVTLVIACDPDDGMIDPDDLELHAGDAEEAGAMIHALDGSPDELVSPHDPAAASCVGYYNGGNFCLASCWDNPGHWVPVGHVTNTAYGHCSNKVDAYCAWHWGTYGACWGWP